MAALANSNLSGARILAALTVLSSHSASCAFDFTSLSHFKSVII